MYTPGDSSGFGPEAGAIKGLTTKIAFDLILFSTYRSLNQPDTKVRENFKYLLFTVINADFLTLMYKQV